MRQFLVISPHLISPTSYLATSSFQLFVEQWGLPFFPASFLEDKLLQLPHLLLIKFFSRSFVSFVTILWTHFSSSMFSCSEALKSEHNIQGTSLNVNYYQKMYLCLALLLFLVEEWKSFWSPFPSKGIKLSLSEAEKNFVCVCVCGHKFKLDHFYLQLISNFRGVIADISGNINIIMEWIIFISTCLCIWSHSCLVLHHAM